MKKALQQSRYFKGCFNCFSKLVQKNKKTIYPTICSKCKTINRQIIQKCFYCGSKESEKWGNPLRDFYSVKCKNCSIVYIKNPLTSISQAKYYDHYNKNVHNKEIKKKKQRDIMYKIELNYLQSLTKNLSGIKNVLDVGCGGGFFLDLLKKKGLKTFGTEIGEDSYFIAKKKHKIYKGDFINELNFREKFDMIVMRGVIEHTEDPKRYVYKGQKLLKKNGYFFISATPDLDSISAEIFKERWTMHRPEVHILHLSERHIDKLFKKDFIKSGSQHLYLGTPYENYKSDLQKIKKEIDLQKKGKKSNLQSPPFFGNMITAVYKKIH